MELREVMTPNPECIPPDTSLKAAAAKMRDCDIGDLLVCENDRLVGIVTDRDIAIRATAEGKTPSRSKVRDVMSEGIVYCFEDQTHEEAAKLMSEKQIRRLPILNRQKRLVGIISLGDLALQTNDENTVEKTLEAVCEKVTVGT